VIVRYRKRPIEVDTVQWTGHNEAELVTFTSGGFCLVDPDGGDFTPDVTAQVYDRLHDTWMGVKTGQHIVTGVQGEHYPIAEDVLAETYELVVEEATAAAATATPELTVYRASHESIVMGLYTTHDAARGHCETEERLSWPKGTSVAFGWVPDDSDPLSPEELVVFAGQNDESVTGYVVTPLEVASEYNAEADE
jgi:hypothetical protein